MTTSAEMRGKSRDAHRVGSDEMQSSLKLVIGEFVRCLALLLVDLNALLLDHTKASVDTFNFINELILCDGASFRLEEHLRFGLRILIVNLSQRGSRLEVG